MIFQDPIVYHALSTHIVEALKESISESSDGTVKTISTNLLEKQNVEWMSFCSQAHNILRLDTVSMPMVDDRIYLTFYNKLLYWTYDDKTRAETARIIHQEIREDNENVPDLSFVLKFGTNEINILNIDDLAMKVLGNDLLDRCQNDNIIALRQALDCFDI
ncbi:Negative elongation factor B [Gigaspora margarita]|uniref:Negative elongation factor B n=1 Tax=Gigaspora margarita TaxID=4874 RepID=A0A8H4AP67_GIGMA|nr:Negative elongation factor B [Gigaspora margarita]